jgi:hypothetical protein
MTVSGSISKVSSTSTSITVSWFINTTQPNFIEAGGSGAGQTLFDFPFGASKPISGSATISGLSPSTSYSFDWYAQDTDGFGGGSYSFSTDAGAPPPFFPPPTFSNPPVWTDNSIFGFASKGESYSDGVSATNSPTYSIISGSLPTGISLNTSTGAITGTPTVGGIFNFTVRASNSDGYVEAALSIEVILSFSIGIPNVTNVTNNSFEFSYFVDNELNGSPATVSFSVSPSGTISSPTSFVVNAGAITNGTRTVSGLSPGTTYTITATMTSGGDSTSDSRLVTTTFPAPSFTDGAVSSVASTIAAYSDGVSASNTNSYSVVSGSLPSGISLNASTGALTGTPTTQGTYNFVIRATGLGGTADTGTLTIVVYGDLTADMNVNVYGATNFLDDYFQGQAFDFSFTAENQTSFGATLTLSISPTASISGSNPISVSAGGEITPTQRTASGMDHGRRYTITATLTLSGGIASVSDTLVVERMNYIFSQPNPGVENCPYTAFSFELISYSPVTFSISSGSLPPGLSLGSTITDTDTGYYNTGYYASVTGTPTATGTYNFTVRATNSQFYAEVVREIVVSEAEDSGLVLSMFSPTQPTEYEAGLYSIDFILEIDASESSSSGAGGLLEVEGDPSITFSDDSFEANSGTTQQRTITVFGLENNQSYIIKASMTINCYETVAFLEVTVGVLPEGIVRVRVDDDWKVGVIRVKSGGAWKVANLRVKVGGVWKLSQ